MSALAWLVATVRFGCEIAATVALAIWGADVTDGATSVLLAVLAPTVAVTVWGAVVAPKATRRLPDPARAVVELVVFAAAVAGVAAVGHPVFAVVLAVCAVGSMILTRTLHAEDVVAGTRPAAD